MLVLEGCEKNMEEGDGDNQKILFENVVMKPNTVYDN